MCLSLSAAAFDSRETDDAFRRPGNYEVRRYTLYVLVLNNLVGLSIHFWRTIIIFKGGH